MTPDVARLQYFASDNNGEFSLKHGFEEDFACFALWEGALSKEDQILPDLENNFTIIANVLVHWSKENYSRNIQRLYEEHGAETSFRGYSEKIGRPPFRFVIVKDHSPSYTWKRSVSGAIEPSNERVVAAKYRYRDLFKTPYQVHSSNNLEEFLVQSSLTEVSPFG